MKKALVILILLTACGKLPDPYIYINYYIGGSGVSTLDLVSYFDENGQSVKLSHVSLPFNQAVKTKVTPAKGYLFGYLASVNNLNPCKLTVSVSIHGDSVKSDSHTTDFSFSAGQEVDVSEFIKSQDK